MTKDRYQETAQCTPSVPSPATNEPSLIPTILCSAIGVIYFAEDANDCFFGNLLYLSQIAVAHHAILAVVNIYTAMHHISAVPFEECTLPTLQRATGSIRLKLHLIVSTTNEGIHALTIDAHLHAASF